MRDKGKMEHSKSVPPIALIIKWCSEHAVKNLICKKKNLDFQENTNRPPRNPSSIIRFQLSKYEKTENLAFAINPADVIPMIRK